MQLYVLLFAGQSIINPVNAVGDEGVRIGFPSPVFTGVGHAVACHWYVMPERQHHMGVVPPTVVVHPPVK